MRATATAQPAAGSGSGNVAGSGEGGGSGERGDVYYGNCAEARAAGAAPVHRGEPGCASYLDRGADGVGGDI